MNPAAQRTTLLKKVQLQAFHEKNGHLTEFAGFNLPLWFKGIIPESLAVRNAAGVFDVSHMGRAMIRGKDSEGFLNGITTNDVCALSGGQGQYSLICNPEGGIKDDVLVFRLDDEEYLVVYNAANRSKDYNWIIEHAKALSLEIQDISDDVAMFAVQGPKAGLVLQRLSSINLKLIPRFGCTWGEVTGTKVLFSRTGYTGEDGFELFVFNAPVNRATNAENIWNLILKQGENYGLEPCGLGARDLLRLEAGLCLYGTDMDEKTNPFEAKLGFVVKLHKDFVGKERLQQVKQEGVRKSRVCLVTRSRVIPRHGYKIISDGAVAGEVTSGTLSPILNTGIAMGYLDTRLATEGAKTGVEVRNRLEEVKIVKPPFYDTTKYGYARKT
jgi:aminomethyltransferase